MKMTKNIYGIAHDPADLHTSLMQAGVPVLTIRSDLGNLEDCVPI